MEQDTRNSLDPAVVPSTPTAAPQGGRGPGLRRLPTQARLVQLLVNPTAGSRKRKRLADELEAELSQARFTVERCDTVEQLGEAASTAHDRGDLRCVIAIGGDGTLNAALNSTPHGVALMAAPQGTENLLAKYFGTPADAAQIARLVADGWTMDLDAGVANGGLFALMAGVGFDADVVRRVHAKRSASGSGNISHLSYAEPILDAIRRYPFPKVRVTTLDERGDPVESVTGSWVFVVNLPRYAQGLRIAPDARGDDGLLDLCVLKRGQAAAGLWYLWHIVRGRHQRLKSVATLRAARCRLETVDGDDVLTDDVPFQIDGDPGGRLPLELGVAPGRMRLLASRAAARGLEEAWSL